MTSSTPGRPSKTGASSAPLLPVTPMAVRCAPGMGCALKPRASIASATPRISSAVAPLRITTSTLPPARRPIVSKHVMICRMPLGQLFQTKSLDELIAETKEEGHQLRRALGPLNLIALGIGAIIGAGLFATIGTAAAGDAQRPGAGPALVLSFVLTASVCALTALCYAEFAAMVPVSGSAYTYAYATLGELVAWIIGWDLILEYAIGNVAVAISWANYFRSLLGSLGIDFPQWLATDYRTAAKIPGLYDSAPHIFGIPVVFNLLAFGIVALITVVLVWGIKESAGFNAIMVGIKILVLLFFIIVALYFVSPSTMAKNWQPFQPNGW